MKKRIALILVFLLAVSITVTQASPLNTLFQYTLVPGDSVNITSDGDLAINGTPALLPIVISSKAKSTPTFTPTATKTRTPTNTPAGGSLVLAINSGGAAVGSFAADKNFNGGNTYNTNAAIDVSGVANPAPAAVYQSERWSNATYTLPGLNAGASYTVRLHFAEIYFTAANKRKFNVSINGSPALSDFDVFAAAGAANKAVIREFTATANSSGQIVVAITNGSLDNCKISGIEVVGGSGATNTPTATRTPTVPVTPAPPTNTPVAGSPVYPLKASADGHYLVDQNNTPFLLAGDSAQGMMAALSEADAQMYLSSRKAAGVNAVWSHILCGSSYGGCNPNGNSYDGIVPFITPGDLSTPNNAYFTRIDHMLQIAGQNGITVIASPVETVNWLDVLRANGTTKAFNYGVYIGNRYKNVPNLIWFHGNDFQTWQTASDDAVVRAVAEGIKSVDTNHLQTLELNYDTSGSLDDSNWNPILGLDAAYSYYPQYVQVLKEYNRSSIPVVFYEGVYEYQEYQGGYLGPYQLRNQEYWASLSGAWAGQLYGNVNIFRFVSGWSSTDWATSPGITQFSFWKALFQNRPWYNLVPDQSHTLVTAGLGTYKNCCLNANSDWLTAAKTPDGKLAMVYLPTRRTITVNLAQFAVPVVARWYDPTNGTYTPVGSFTNVGTATFAPTSNNAGGDGDWVLILEGN